MGLQSWVPGFNSLVGVGGVEIGGEVMQWACNHGYLGSIPCQDKNCSVKRYMCALIIYAQYVHTWKRQAFH